MVRAHRDGLRAWTRGEIVPFENVDGVEAATEFEGVLALAVKGGEMAHEFDTFCKKHLCQESWDFIVDATHYENMVHTRSNVTDPSPSFTNVSYLLQVNTHPRYPRGDILGRIGIVPTKNEPTELTNLWRVFTGILRECLDAGCSLP